MISSGAEVQQQSPVAKPETGHESRCAPENTPKEKPGILLSHRSVKKSDRPKQQHKVGFDSTKTHEGRIGKNTLPISFPLDFLATYLGLEDVSPEYYSDHFDEKLATYDHAEDLQVLLIWGRDRGISDQQMERCEENIAKCLCSDILYLAPFCKKKDYDNMKVELLEAMLSVFQRGKQLNPKGKKKMEPLKALIQDCLTAPWVTMLMNHMPYSGFARYYRLLQVAGLQTKECLPFIKDVMKQSLRDIDLLQQLIQDLKTENPEQVKEAARLEPLLKEAEQNRFKHDTGINISRNECPVEEEAKARAFRRINDCYEAESTIDWEHILDDEPEPGIPDEPEKPDTQNGEECDSDDDLYS